MSSTIPMARLAGGIRSPGRPNGAVRRIGAAIGAAGMAGALAGTFLPWLASGGVLRNSYAIVGILGRLGLAGSGLAATALAWWPLLGPVAMVAVIAGVLRRWSAAALVTFVIGFTTSLIGGAVLALAGGHGAAGVAVVNTGPIVTLAGGVSAILGATLVLVGNRLKSVRRKEREYAP